ncbi:zinc finger protein 436-like [Protopterus annectens]|uniref:zinc finger protein 436-like n=1 Tax=Protopterus annectens TaxID=7888 RepID=UPI001CFB9584|nr:zinc finger protein 436-like [Protopterus annectens]
MEIVIDLPNGILWQGQGPMLRIIETIHVSNSSKKGRTVSPTKNEVWLKVKQQFPTLWSQGPTDCWKLQEAVLVGSDENFIPLFQKQYQIPKEAETDMQNCIQRWLNVGIIQKEDSPTNSPIWPIKKKDGTCRLVIDLRKVNQFTTPGAHIIPGVPEQAARIKPQSQWFTVIDLSNGFFAVPLQEKDWQRFAFTFQNKQYVMTQLPQGFQNSPKHPEQFLTAAPVPFTSLEKALIPSSLGRRVPETFEDVAVTFSEEEWKLLRKQDKDLHREVMVQNYETLVSVGYKIPPEKLLLLLKADNGVELPGEDVEKNTLEQNENLESKLSSIRMVECSVSLSQRPSLGTPYLPYPTDSLQQCVKAYNILHPTPVLKHHSGHNCNKSFEAPPLRHPKENLQHCVQPVKGSNRLHLPPLQHPQSAPNYSKKLKCDNGTPLLHHPTENQPVKSSDRFPLPSVPLLYSENKQSKTLKCTTSFTDPQSLVTYQKSYTKSKPYKCEECSMCFTQQSNLLYHNLLYHQVVQSKSFPTQQSLTHHQKIHSDEQNKCGKSFSHQLRLECHQASDTEKDQYPCGDCGKCFTSKAGLAYHQATHSGQKPFQCTECSKCFARKINLILHQFIHTGKKPYKCDECSKCYFRKSNLLVHQKTHTGVKPYKCTVCSKSFIMQYLLTNHQRIHTGEKPYKCSECSKSFSRRTCLKSHQTTHTREKPYKCTECNKCFTRSSNLKRHRASHTSMNPSGQ